MSLTEKQKIALDKVVEELSAMSSKEFREALKRSSNGDIAKIIRHSGMLKNLFEEELESERSKVKVLVEALRFYAKGKHIYSHPFTHDGEEYIKDRGTIALEALKKAGIKLGNYPLTTSKDV